MIEAILAKVHQVINRIGSNADAAGTSTLFARLTQNATNLGSDADASSANGSAHGKLKDIKSFLSTNVAGPVPTSPIKSIQRGTSQFTANNQTLSVAISSVNTSKAVLTITSLYTEESGAGAGSSSNIHCELTSATNLSLYLGYHNSQNGANPYPIISWQVVEYV